MINELWVRIFKDGVEHRCPLFSDAQQVNFCFRRLTREFTYASAYAWSKSTRQSFDVVAERGVRSDRDRQAMAQRVATATPLTGLRSRAGAFLRVLTIRFDFAI